MVLLIGTGMSQDKNSLKAGKLAAQEAIKELQGKKASIIIVFSSPRKDHSGLLKGIQSMTGSVPMVGGTTAGEVSNHGYSKGSVVIMAIYSDKIKFVAGLGSGIKGAERKVGAVLVENIKAKSKSLTGAKSLLIFPDALAGDGFEIVKGIQEKLGENFEIVGGALGDEADFKKTYQYHNGKVYNNAVVGLMIFGTSFNTFTGVGSAWKSIGNRFKCTKAEGAVVHSFDNKPALDVYKTFLGEERSKKLPAIGLEYPFGMIDERAKVAGKEYFQIRCPLSVDEKSKTVTLAAAIPEGKDVTLTMASRNDVVNNAGFVAKKLKKDMAGAKPKAIMLFSCVACKMVLGIKVSNEVKAVRDVLGADVPIIGFYTYGEIGPIDKNVSSLRPTKWHNETIVLWALTEKNSSAGKVVAKKVVLKKKV